jgi:hypothetical protein
MAATAQRTCFIHVARRRERPPAVHAIKLILLDREAGL